MACHAAVRAGDRLTPAEIAALLAQRHLAQDAHHCPHGRPTSLRFTRRDLDRQFRCIKQHGGWSSSGLKLGLAFR